MEVFLFYLFSGIALGSAIIVITHPQPPRALVALIVTMFSLAVLYLLLGAPFLAMVHLIVYAGAILVLFLFVIMLSGISSKEIPFKMRFRRTHWLLSILVGIIFLTLLGMTLSSEEYDTAFGIEGTVEVLGQNLFGRYLLPFELISLLLLLGIFAAVSLAKKGEE